MKKKTRLKLIIFALCMLVLIIAISLLRGYFESKSNSLVSYTVRKEMYENNIEISGNIEAANEQKMQSPGESTVVKVYVKQGDRVKQGQLLVELDSTSEAYNLARLDYDIEQKRLSGALKEIQLALKQRVSYVKNLNDRKFFANFDGIVAKLSIKEGEVTDIKDEVGVIIDRSYLKASVEIVETDANKLQSGQKVLFTFPAYKSREPVIGYVESFPAVGRITTRGATVVDAEIRIENPPDQILTGFSFTGKIEISPPREVLIVEAQAIGYEQGKAFAEVQQSDGGYKRVDVEVRPYGQSFVEIALALKEGDILKQQSLSPRSGRLNQRGRPPSTAAAVRAR
ncbi:MAG: efflux RND transporter periplasmic adaptor subunit [Treponemataceae bacterium]